MTRRRPSTIAIEPGLAGDIRGERSQPRPAPFVIVTDQLPGQWTTAGTTVGISGLPDDPVTTGLAGAGARRRGVWVGRAQQTTTRPYGVALHALDTDPEDAEGYQHHALATMWPLYHGLVRPATHERTWREAYRRVSHAYAVAVAQQAEPGASVWVHDHHLQLVPAMLRRLRPDLRIGLYLTTTFPSPDLFQQTPMHTELMLGVLGADLVGFQTAQAAENFLRLTHLPRTDSPADMRARAGEVEVGVYPTSVDTAGIDALMRQPETRRRAAALRQNLGDPRVVVLSIDRPDETAGTQRRLRVLGAMLGSGALRPEEIAVVQVVTDEHAGAIPAGGRDGEDPAASTVVSEIAQEVARINGRFASVGRPCVHYVRQSPTLAERVALYLAADVLMATPLQEGASLPALEFAAAGRRDSALVLSEFSGSSVVLPEAFAVNPYDDDHVRSALLAAIAAGPDERERRMAAMRMYVASYDTHAWARLFLIALRDAVVPTDRAASAHDRTDPAVLLRHSQRPIAAIQHLRSWRTGHR